jgi:hypothetical protein
MQDGTPNKASEDMLQCNGNHDSPLWSSQPSCLTAALHARTTVATQILFGRWIDTFILETLARPKKSSNLLAKLWKSNSCSWVKIDTLK